MVKAFLKIISILFFVLLISCGSNQADIVENQLSIGIPPTTKSAEFGKPANAEAVAAISKELASYFNGQYANNPKALMGTQATALTANMGKTATTMVAASNIASPVFRFFNTNTGAHFFTMSVAERDYVKNTYPFFSYEGTSFFAYPAADPALSPVYRFFNMVTGTHFFTISAVEKDHVIATWPHIYSFEGIAWYANTASSTNLVPVYRFFNTRTGTHFYTTSVIERDNVIATLPWYLFEGIAYYVRQDASIYALVANGVGGYYDKTECVADTRTGLIWQGQTPAGTGLRANNQYKTNFTSTTELQKATTITGAVTYIAPTQAEVDSVNNTLGFINAINATNLCGSSAWRLPTKEELLGIVKASENPSIDNAWFPNTVASYAAPYSFYYTSTPYQDLTTNVWGVSFAGGGALVLGRDNGFGLGKTLARLVR
jgi:Protein of unknown function (DUF1566)/Repeat of unknown function (DUF5648)